MSVLYCYFCDGCGHQRAHVDWWTLGWKDGEIIIRPLDEDRAYQEFIAHACSSWCAGKLARLFMEARKFPEFRKGGQRSGNSVMIAKGRFWWADHELFQIIEKEVALVRSLRKKFEKVNGGASQPAEASS